MKLAISNQEIKRVTSRSEQSRGQNLYNDGLSLAWLSANIWEWLKLQHKDYARGLVPASHASDS